MQTLSTFPTITQDLALKLRLQVSPYSFFYAGDDGEEYDLTADESSASAHALSDEHGRWSPDTDGFGISRSYTIRCASFLFGKNGVCCEDASVALVLIWKSADSRQRSAIEIGTITNSSMPQSLSLNRQFPKPKFRGRVDLETAVVIKAAGNPTEDEMHLANIPGTVLGVIDSYSVLFDGAGSAFPINIISDKDGVLWSVGLDFKDPTEESFNETVSINLNSAHKDYKYINPSDRTHYNPSFLREVLASAMSTIVDYVREGDYWDDIKNDQSEDGTVGQAIYYFSKTLNLNLDDAKQCSVAFRNYFEQKLAEI